jgi:CDP-glucose 4,6-dehydratase
MEENFVSVNQLIHALVSRVGAGDVQINSDGTDREATLLKLNIEKARTMLGWHPVLDFDSTVQFTVEGYTMARHDPLRARIQQIHEYAEILHARVPDWGCPASACG